MTHERRLRCAVAMDFGDITPNQDPVEGGLLAASSRLRCRNPYLASAFVRTAILHQNGMSSMSSKMTAPAP